QNTGIIYSIDARAGLISGTLADMAGGSGRSGGMIVMSTHTACACKWSGNKCGTDYNGVIVIGVSNCGRIVAEANRAEIQYLSCE
ncbi:MAG: hypothetical protein LBI01_06645, partial [Elusimicrobium sp.]|nr:hypothetical protein [Elusimicrobium sp.]